MVSVEVSDALLYPGFIYILSCHLYSRDSCIDPMLGMLTPKSTAAGTVLPLLWTNFTEATTTHRAVMALPSVAPTTSRTWTKTM